MFKRINLCFLLLLLLNGFIYSQESWKTFYEEIKTANLNSGNLTLNLTEDNSGNLLLTNAKGFVLKYDRSNWNTYNYLLKTKTSFVDWCPAVIDKNSGNIWFGSNASIAMWNGSDIYVMTGYVDDDGKMIYSYGGKDPSLCTFENNKKIAFETEEIIKNINSEDTDVINYKFSPYNIKCTFIDSKNRFWLGNYAGELIRRDKDNWIVDQGLLDMNVEKMNKYYPNRINKIFEDADGVLWILTNSCIATYDQGKYVIKKLIRVPYSIFQDSKKNIWVGYVSGLAKFDGTDWQLFEKESGIEKVLTPGKIIEDKAGNIWFCAKTVLATRKGGGLYKYDGNRWESIKVDKKGYYSDILLDSKGNFWLTTISGFYQYQDNNWTLIKKLNKFGTFYLEMYEDKSGDIWFGTSTVQGYLERYTP